MVGKTLGLGLTSSEPTKGKPHPAQRMAVILEEE